MYFQNTILSAYFIGWVQYYLKCLYFVWAPRIVLHSPIDLNFFPSIFMADNQHKSTLLWDTTPSSMAASQFKYNT